jgi:hypothetical protein
MLSAHLLCSMAATFTTAYSKFTTNTYPQRCTCTLYGCHHFGNTTADATPLTLLVLSEKWRDTYLLLFESFQLCAAAPEALNRLRGFIGDPCSCCSGTSSIDLVQLSLALVNVAGVAQVVDVNKLVLRGAALNALEVLDVHKVLVVAVARREQRPAAVLTPVRQGHNTKRQRWDTVSSRYDAQRLRSCACSNVLN